MAELRKQHEETHSHTLKPPRRPNRTLEHLLPSESSNLRMKKNPEVLHSRTQLARFCDRLCVYIFLIFKQQEYESINFLFYKVLFTPFYKHTLDSFHCQINFTWWVVKLTKPKNQPGKAPSIAVSQIRRTLIRQSHFSFPIPTGFRLRPQDTLPVPGHSLWGFSPSQLLPGHQGCNRGRSLSNPEEAEPDRKSVV